MQLGTALFTSMSVLAVVATSSHADTSHPPVLASKPGFIELIADGHAKPLVTCQVVRAFYIIPDRQVRRTEEPCTFDSLIVHQATGRWSATVDMTSAEYHWREDLRIGGTSIALPPAKQQRKGEPGRVNRVGSVLVTGDLQGFRAASLGDLATWAEVGEEINFQAPLAFTDATSIVVYNKRGKKSWNTRITYDLARPPQGIARMDYTGNKPTALAAGDARYVTVTGKRTTLHVPGAKPRVLPIRADGRPAVVGNSVIYFRPGTWEDNHCYPENTGSIRSYDLHSGADTQVFSSPHMCGYLFDPFTVNPARGTVMFRADSGQGGRMVYEYTSATGALRELDRLWTGRILDVSADGRFLIVQGQSQHFSVYDVDTQAHVASFDQGGTTAPVAAFAGR